MVKFKCQCGTEVDVTILEESEGYLGSDVYAKVKCGRCGCMMQEVSE